MTNELKPQPDDLMITREAARLLGLSADMVRWLERGRRLPAQRTRNGFRLADDVEKFEKLRLAGLPELP